MKHGDINPHLLYRRRPDGARHVMGVGLKLLGAPTTSLPPARVIASSVFKVDMYAKYYMRQPKSHPKRNLQ